MTIDELERVVHKTGRLIKQEILVQYKEDLPALVWGILWPLLLAAGLVMAFQAAQGGSSSGLETVFSTYFGVLIWTTGSAVLISNLNTWKPDRGAITDITFSFTLLSVVDVTVKYIFLLIQLVIAVTVWLILVPHAQWHLAVAYLPIYLLALYLALLAMAWVASLVGAVTPDLTYALPPVLLLLLVLSPVCQRNGDMLPWMIQMLNDVNPFAIWVDGLYATIDVAKSGPTPPLPLLAASMVAVVIGRFAVRGFYRNTAKMI